MNLAVTIEYRFDRTPDGAIWTRTAFQYSFWQRYLAVYDSVRIIARLNDVSEPDPSWKRVDGTQVSAIGIPHYIGPLQYVRKLRSIQRALRGALSCHDAVIMRVGSPIADLLQPMLLREGRPYGVEVVGDPWDVFGPGVFKHPLRPILRRWFSQKLKNQCRHAAAASYVTASALQERYPLRNGAFSIAASSIELLPEHFAKAPRTFASQPGVPVRVLLVGTLEQLQKAPDIAIRALAACISKGANLELAIVGDGRCRMDMQNLASGLGISEKVRFLGQKPAGDPIRSELDRSDLFLLPSRGEGLPRAMIEAMARGLPCIGSHVGGIPELIPADDRVTAGRVDELAAKLIEVTSDPSRMNLMAARNLEKAREYDAGLLQTRRERFYRKLAEETQLWVETRGKPR